MRPRQQPEPLPEDPPLATPLAFHVWTVCALVARICKKIDEALP